MRNFLLGPTLRLAACASGPTTTATPTARPYAMLLFGDHGYDLDYLEADERNPPLTLEQAIAAEREEWAEDKRPPAEFAPSAMIQLPDIGGYVAASGMMPVSPTKRTCPRGAIVCNMLPRGSACVITSGVGANRSGLHTSIRTMPSTSSG